MVRTRLRIMKLLTENNMGLLFKADSRGAATCIYYSINGETKKPTAKYKVRIFAYLILWNWF